VFILLHRKSITEHNRNSKISLGIRSHGFVLELGEGIELVGNFISLSDSKLQPVHRGVLGIVAIGLAVTLIEIGQVEPGRYLLGDSIGIMVSFFMK